MRALWFAPPSVLLAGSAAVGWQLRRVASERHLLIEAMRRVERDRLGLSRLRAATVEARASLEGFERR